MQEQEAISYHAILKCYRGNFRATQKFYEGYHGWQSAWSAHCALHACKFDPVNEYETLRKGDIVLILKDDPRYPPLLRETPWAPLALYAKGNIELFTGKVALAIVGTRKATPSGLALASLWAEEIVRAGVIIVSGLALGIDAAAHAGALEGQGHTIAVLGNGIDEIYPKTNERLGEKILMANGLIISEYPPQTPSLPIHFLERNRIIAGLAKSVLVVESPTRSGTLTTARYAAEAGREVLVVPGPISHPNFRGSHALIREGATLVRETEDVLESMGITSGHNETSMGLTDPAEIAVAKVFEKNSGDVQIETMLEESGLPAQEVNRALAFLMMKHMITESGDGYALAKTNPNVKIKSSNQI